MENFIKKAMEDEQKRLRDGPVLDVVPVVENPDLRRSLVHVDFQTSLESLDDNGRASTIYQVTSPTPPDGIQYSPPRRYSPIEVTSVQRMQPVMASAPSPPVNKRQHSMEGLDGMTYIAFEPKTRRPVVSENGPVYMYLSRQSNKYGGRSSPSRGRTGSPDYSSGIYNGRSSDYYRY